MTVTFEDACAAIRAAGAKDGDVVFTHHNLAFFGKVENCHDMNDLSKFWLDAFRAAIGDAGTLVLPTFTYSFGSDKDEKVFDPVNSLSKTGALGNYALTNGLGKRSLEPMLSVVCLGAKEDVLADEVGPVCFGSQSIWERLHEQDALICNLNLDSGSTYLHWVEREVGVDYRHDIPMEGLIRLDNQMTKKEIIYTGRSLDEEAANPYFADFHGKCVEQQVTTQVKLGRGQINSHRCQKIADFTRALLSQYPRILTKASSFHG